MANNVGDFDYDNIYDVLTTNLRMNVSENSITDLKLIFIKQYSERIINRVKCIANKELYFLFNFFNNDDYDPLDEKEKVFYLIDDLFFYSFKINNKKYYLLYSNKYDNDYDRHQTTKYVEFFRES